jgi:hypothetical protein
VPDMNTLRNRSAVVVAAALVVVGGLSACSGYRSGVSSSSSSVDASSRSSGDRINPSFSASISKASTALEEVQNEPRPYARPVVIVAGAEEPGFAVAQTGGIFRYATTDPEQVVVVPFFSERSFEEARERLVEVVSQKFPSGARGETAEVDVVGIGIGGLVARDAAIDRPGQTRLNMHALYTISTPHRGASVPGPWASDVRPGSAFLRNLDRNYDPADYEMYGYVRLEDTSMDPMSAAPPNGNLWWLPSPPLEYSHVSSHRDPRILADIARRMRMVPEEPAFGTLPPASFPNGQVIATVPTTD